MSPVLHRKVGDVILIVEDILSYDLHYTAR